MVPDQEDHGRSVRGAELGEYDRAWQSSARSFGLEKYERVGRPFLTHVNRPTSQGSQDRAVQDARFFGRG